jgi:hypothetical protein
MQKAKLILLNSEAEAALKSILSAAMKMGDLELINDLTLFCILLEKSAEVNISEEFVAKEKTHEKLRQLSIDNLEFKTVNT